MSKIVSLQILRGFAATSVASFHLYAAAKAEGFDPGLFALFAGGEIGVDIFFVLSGFIITYVSHNRPGMTSRAFLWARFWRIVPPYWAILSLYIAASLVLAALLGDTSKLPDLTGLIVSYLVLPYPEHIIIIAWTLSVEIVFYAVFALTFFTGGTKRLVTVMVVWVVLTQGFNLLANQPTWLLLPLHSAVLEFLFGILIALRFLSPSKDSRRVHLAASIVGAIAVLVYMVTGGGHGGPIGREILAGIPSAILVFGAVGLALKDKPVLETWGESSYILYLFHLLYFSVLGTMIEVATGINVYGSQIGMLLMLGTVVAISYAATLWFERPYQKWYRRFLT